MIRKIQLTTIQLKKLMADLTALPAEPIGPHLSDEALFGYTMGTLDSAKMQEVDLHLASCVECVTKAEPLVEASQVWFSEAGERWQAALRERLLVPQPPAGDTLSLLERLKRAFKEMVDSFNAVIQVPQPLAADTQDKKRREFWKDQSSEGLLRWGAVLDSRGNVTFRFSSKNMACAGSRFVLRWGKLEREVTLGQVSATEAGAKVVISSHECPDDLKAAIEVARLTVAE